MKIVIPSNREEVISIKNFSPELMEHVDIVRHHKPKNGDIGWMRQQYIDEYYLDGHENIIMLDDDLPFVMTAPSMMIRSFGFNVILSAILTLQVNRL